MAINTSNNKVRIISTTVGLANSNKYTEINSPALVVNTSDGGIFYADGTAKNPFKQLAALPNHTHDDYLSTSGGTIKGSLKIEYSSPHIAFKTDANTIVGSLGIFSGKLSYYQNSDGTYNDIIHSNNIGGYKAGGAVRADYANSITSYGIPQNLQRGEAAYFRFDNNVNENVVGLPAIDNANGVLAFNRHDGKYHSLLGFSSSGLYYANADNRDVASSQSWKQLAFTDSNVASANKLATPRLIYGTLFDGTGDITGPLCLYGASGVSYDIWLDNQTLNGVNFRRNDTSSLLFVSENVGVGTTTPQAKLHVNGDAKVDGRLDLNVLSAPYWYSGRKIPNEEFIIGGAGHLGLGELGMLIQTYANQPIIFRTSGSNQMRMLGNGNVAIGSTTADEKLHVYGNVKANSFIGNLTGTATDTLRVLPERFDTNAPIPSGSHGLTFQFSYGIDPSVNDWWNVLNMRSYSDPNYTSAQIITPAGNPGKDDSYSGDMKWRQGRNSTWMPWKTILDSNNIHFYALSIAGGTVYGDIRVNGGNLDIMASDAGYACIGLNRNSIYGGRLNSNYEAWQIEAAPNNNVQIVNDTYGAVVKVTQSGNIIANSGFTGNLTGNVTGIASGNLPLSGGLISGGNIAFGSDGLPRLSGAYVPAGQMGIASNGILLSGKETYTDGAAIFLESVARESNRLIIGLGDDANNSDIMTNDYIAFRYYGTDGVIHAESKIPNKTGVIALTSDIPTKVSQLPNDVGYTTATGHTHNQIIGNSNSSNPANALLKTGSGRPDASPAGDTWIFFDEAGSTSTPWGFKHEQGDDLIGFYGAGVRTSSIRLRSGQMHASNFITDSDIRLKTNIKPLPTNSKSLELNFYEFDYVNNDNHSAGHIAQEVKDVLPEFVHGNESETEHLSIDYTGLHSMQIKALLDRIIKLEEEIKILKSSK